jgi:CheY-like chemotaxis protein
LPLSWLLCGRQLGLQLDGKLPILDLHMSGLGGLAMVEQLKSSPARREIPVVILTAFADSANTIDAMRLGAFDHLTKRVGRDDVKAVLDCALARPQAVAAVFTSMSASAKQIPANMWLDPRMNLI